MCDTQTAPQSLTEFHHLTPGQVRLNRDNYHRLVLTLAGAVYESVKPVRPFPLTAPESCVFLLDREGHEIGLVEQVGALEPASRDLLREALALEYLSTRILAIRSVKSRHGVTTWDLRTDRGDRVTHVRDRSDIRKLPGNRVLLTDTDGMRYEVPDTSKLDERSLALLESEV
jgi:hypothetical protein